MKKKQDTVLQFIRLYSYFRNLPAAWPTGYNAGLPHIGHGFDSRSGINIYMAYISFSRELGRDLWVVYVCVHGIPSAGL